MSEILDPETLFLQAVERHQAGQLPEAERLYRQTLGGPVRASLLPDIHNNLGVLLRRNQRLAEAEAAFKLAQQLRPGWASPHYNLGNLYSYSRRLAEAEAAYLETLRIDPDFPSARYNLGLVYLSQGRLPEGWPLYDLRTDRETTVMKQLSFSEWKGEPLAGKSLLVWREQGFGDEIQMARFVPLLKAAGAKWITLAPPKALTRLFTTLGADAVEKYIGQVTIPRHDYWVLPCSIPDRLGATLETIPRDPYLSAPSEARGHWTGFAPPGFNVGFVWRGNPQQANDTNRSLPSPEPLLTLGDIGVNMIDLQEPRGDFADTAAIIEQLDLILTVDTSMAHLAGAMGKPCWVMLAALGTCWRYPNAPETASQWYPSVTVYRQPAPGDWQSVLTAVRRDLRQMAQSPARDRGVW